jgi:acetylornithine deacetylase
MARIVNLIEKYQSELTGGETVSVGTIKGGTAVNIVPDSCTIEIDRRLTENTYPEKSLEDMKKYLSANLDFDSTMSELKDAQNAVLVPEDHSGVRMMSELLPNGLCSSPRRLRWVRCFRMNAAGIPTVLWGPGP